MSYTVGMLRDKLDSLIHENPKRAGALVILSIAPEDDDSLGPYYEATLNHTMTSHENVLGQSEPSTVLRLEGTDGA